MRALTHADSFLCPHGCPILPAPPTGNLVINGAKVLLLDELKSATVACVAGAIKCNTIVSATNPDSARTVVQAKEPALKGVKLMTDKGQAMMIPAPGPHAWQLGAAPPFETPPPPIVCISPEERTEALKLDKPPLRPGVYLGSRRIKGMPSAKFTGEDLEGRHQFLVLVLESSSGFQNAQSMGGGVTGLTLGGHNTDQFSDAIEMLVGRRDYLVAKVNQESDLAAAKEWIAGTEPEVSKWGATLCRVSPPAGQKLPDFQKAVRMSFENYVENIKQVPIE